MGYLWHVNALIAASSDFEHLLLGIEIVSFVNSYYEETESTNGSPNQELESGHENDSKEPTTTENILKTPIRRRSADRGSMDIEAMTEGVKGLTTATTIQCEWLNDENSDSNTNANARTNVSPMLGHPITDTTGMVKGGDVLQEYRGKISSPISFRMRQQKRMMQSERGSRASSASASFMSYGQQNKGSVDVSLLDN